MGSLFIAGLIFIPGHPFNKNNLLAFCQNNFSPTPEIKPGHKTGVQTNSINSAQTMQAILDENTSVEKVATGFQFTEGPLWHPDGFLIFSDIPGNTLYKFTLDRPVEIFRQPSDNANGNTLDRENRLITADQKNRRVIRMETDGKIVALVDQFEGKPFNSPNDLVVKSDGSIYFTDPPYGINKEQEELGFYGVYRLSPDGQITLLTQQFERPNGLTFSPDEQQLYISDSQISQIHVFEIRPDGTLANGRLFAELKDPSQSGVSDGIKVDLKGNLYSTGPGGVWVFSPAGQLLGKIPVPEYTANLAWGDSDYQTLYITASKSLYRVRLKTPGVRPGKG